MYAKTSERGRERSRERGRERSARFPTSRLAASWLPRRRTTGGQASSPSLSLWRARERERAICGMQMILVSHLAAAAASSHPIPPYAARINHDCQTESGIARASSVRQNHVHSWLHDQANNQCLCLYYLCLKWKVRICGVMSLLLSICKSMPQPECLTC